MEKISDISVSEENKIDDVISNLYRRIQKNIDEKLISQLKILGVKKGGVKGRLKKVIYPNDQKALVSYMYDNTVILRVRISDNGMAIEFDIPNLKDTPEDEELAFNSDDPKDELPDGVRCGPMPNPETCQHNMMAIENHMSGVHEGFRCRKCGHTEWS